MKIYYITRVPNGHGMSKYTTTPIETDDQLKAIKASIDEENKTKSHPHFYQVQLFIDNIENNIPIDSDNESAFDEEEIKDPYDFDRIDDYIDSFIVKTIDDALEQKYGKLDVPTDNSLYHMPVNPTVEEVAKMRSRFYEKHYINMEPILTTSKYTRKSLTANDSIVFIKKYTETPDHLYLVTMKTGATGCGCFGTLYYVGVYKDYQKAQNMLSKCRNFAYASQILYDQDNSQGDVVQVDLILLDHKNNIYVSK